MKKFFLAALALLALAPFSFEAQAQTLVGWGVTASASNATATATKAAVTGQQFIITGVSGSCSAAPAAPVLLQLKDGTTVVWEGYISAPSGQTFPQGVAMTRGNAASAVLATCGSGNLGKANLQGATR